MELPLRFAIRFDGLEGADAGQAADSLRRTLQEVDPTIRCKRLRSDADAMDFGAILQVVLAGHATVELARGLTNWLSHTHSSKLTVIDADGKIIVENISAKQAFDLAEKLRAGNGRR
jgi:hypothetical protein